MPVSNARLQYLQQRMQQRMQQRVHHILQWDYAPLLGLESSQQSSVAS